MAEAERNLLKEIREALGMTPKEFIREWKLVPENDKEQIREAVRNGSLTY